MDSCLRSSFELQILSCRSYPSLHTTAIPLMTTPSFLSNNPQRIIPAPSPVSPKLKYRISTEPARVTPRLISGAAKRAKCLLVIELLARAAHTPEFQHARIVKCQLDSQACCCLISRVVRVEAAGRGAWREEFLPSGFETLLDAAPNVAHCA